jgi:uncharacterized membrane protein
MPKSQYKSNSELKYLARMQMGRHMGILIGAALLNTIISYLAVDIFSYIISTDTTVGFIMNYVVTFIVQVLVSVLDLGLVFIYMKTACNMKSSMGDLFFGYRHHFLRAIKIGLILAVISSICMIPAQIATSQFVDILDNNAFFNSFMLGGNLDSYDLLESYTVLSSAMMKYYLIMLVSFLVSFVLKLPFFPAYYMLLDFPNQSVTEILRKCFEVMRGNMFRVIWMYASFVPLMLLSVFTLGIGLIWVIPYMKMTAANFYLDLMSVRNKNMHFNKTV